ncbi:MAG: hypothetical protein LBR34_07030 [Prevotella sp.]|jgi:hypothetical protein|nr:hypothetical protein [Prevotella sp.]
MEKAKEQVKKAMGIAGQARNDGGLEDGNDAPRHSDEIQNPINKEKRQLLIYLLTRWNSTPTMVFTPLKKK